MWCLQRLLDVSSQLQQAQADLMASSRQADQLQQQLSSAQQQVQTLGTSKADLTQVALLPN